MISVLIFSGWHPTGRVMSFFGALFWRAKHVFSTQTCRSFAFRHLLSEISWLHSVKYLTTKLKAKDLHVCTSQSNTNHIVSPRSCVDVISGWSLSGFEMVSLPHAVPIFLLRVQCLASRHLSYRFCVQANGHGMFCLQCHTNIVPCLAYRSNNCQVDYVLGSAF